MEIGMEIEMEKYKDYEIEKDKMIEKERSEEHTSEL